ncbi:MAG: tetratricopeptide repeat protein [Alphaproteobacteria bacterium]|nr:tetratricopeptide repeat protein [Alphaproteobacteria bacterium]
MNRKQRRAGDRRPPLPTGDGGDHIALHAAGVKAFRSGQLGAAAALLAKAIAINGEMPDFHYNLAITLRAQGKLKEAAASYRRAILLKPDYADAHNNLGNVWKALGKPQKARASFEQALQLRPGNADTQYSLGVLCNDLGNRDEAARHFQRCLELDPDDCRGAQMLLAKLGMATIPDRAPHAQLLSIYEVRSHFWDRENSYFGHTLVLEGLQQHAADNKMDILDIGCGTGLVGAQVRHLAARLDGVDVSPEMLEKAAKKGLYDRLERADLVPALLGHAQCYDAVLGAGILIHFGDLDQVFQAAAACLREQGIFIFTLFSNEMDGKDFSVAAHDKLAQSGCYMHSTGYVERLSAKWGFSVGMLKRCIHENDLAGNPVPGLLAVLRRSVPG